MNLNPRKIRLIPLVGVLIGMIGLAMEVKGFDAGKTVFELGFVISLIGVLIGVPLAFIAYRNGGGNDD